MLPSTNVLNVIMLSVVMLSVVAPRHQRRRTKAMFVTEKLFSFFVMTNPSGQELSFLLLSSSNLRRDSRECARNLKQADLIFT